MRTQFIALFVAAAVAPSVLAGGTSATWNLSNPNGEQGNTKTYFDTTNTVSLVARGYVTTSGPVSPALGQTWGPGGLYSFSTGTITRKNLYGKNEGAGETGLGLAGLSSNEIQHKSFIQLDMANAKAAGYTNLTMLVGSIQADEGYFLWGSNTVGVPGTLLRTKVGLPETDTFSVPQFNTYRYFSVSATPIVAGGSSSDILIENGLVASVPTPGAAGLLALGGLVAVRRRR